MTNLAEDLKLPQAIEGLNVRETKFVVELLCSGSVPSATKAAGVNITTGYKWANSDKIKNSLDKLREAFVMHSLQRSKLFLNVAVDKVFDIMQDPKSTKPTQLNAAKILIELSERALEKTDIINRLNELEQMQKEQENE